MAERVIDRLITIFGFQVDPAGLAQAQTKLEQIQHGIGQVGTGLAIGGAALIGAGFVVGQAILEFERGMNLLAAVSNASASDMERFRMQAHELGRTTRFSAEQAAAAQIALAQAGLQVEEVLAVMPNVLQLAAAGNLTMAESAEIVTKTLAPFGLGVEHDTRLADLLATTAANANTTVKEMGPAFRQVAAEAASVGLSMEQTAGMLALLRNNARQAGQAGTQFRGVLLSIIQPTNEAREAMEGLGLDPDRIASLAQLGRFDDAMRELGEAGLTAASAQNIFERESAGAALILATQQGTYREMIRTFEDMDGAAERMANTLESGVVGEMNRLRSLAEGLKLALGEAGVTDAIIFFVHAMNLLLILFNDPAMGWFAKLLAWAIAAGPIMLGVGAALRVLAWSFAGLPAPIAGALVSMGLWVKGVVAATLAHVGLNLATWHWYVLLVAIFAIIGAIIANWRKVAEWFGWYNPNQPGPGGPGSGGISPPSLDAALNPVAPVTGARQPDIMDRDNQINTPAGLDAMNRDNRVNVPAGAGGLGGGNVTNQTSRTNVFQVDQFNVHTGPNADSEDIAQNAVPALEREFENAMDNQDSTIDH